MLHSQLACKERTVSAVSAFLTERSLIQELYPIAHTVNLILTRMRANAQCDGRPAEYRWHPLFNAAKFG